ncbi:hypothetical protein [Alicyclobacillus sp. SP_1]|nr:hypothetical protein [Alicyclobacillus sp. SP_1]
MTMALLTGCLMFANVYAVLFWMVDRLVWRKPSIRIQRETLRELEARVKA